MHALFQEYWAREKCLRNSRLLSISDSLSENPHHAINHTLNNLSKNSTVPLLSFRHILPKYVELRQNDSPLLGTSPNADQVAKAEVALSHRLHFCHCIIHHYSEQMLLDLCQNALNSSQWYPYKTLSPTVNLVNYVVSVILCFQDYHRIILFGTDL